MKKPDLYREGVSPEKRPDAEIRQSQLVGVFGPGALVDFVEDAAIMAGLAWWARGERIDEERLSQAIARAFKKEGEPLVAPDLFAPPIDDDEADAKDRRWIKAFAFPEWFVCQNDQCWEDAGYERQPGRAPRRLLHKNSAELVAGAHRCDGGRGKKSPVQPIRFVRACRKGHVDDIDWPKFVHADTGMCGVAELWLEEAGMTGDLGEVRVFCKNCPAQVRMSEAEWKRIQKTKRLGTCPGKRPWIGDRQLCDETARLLLRSASHAYFPLHQSAVFIPDPGAEIREAVASVWDFVKNAKSAAHVQMFRELQDPVRAALEGVSDDAALAEIVRRRSEQPVAQRGLKSAELDAFLRQPPAVSERFHTELCDLPASRVGPIAKVERLVLAPRLVEVRAQIGFTRFEARTTDPDGEVDVGVEVADLAASREWLPAVENKGEGFFFSLSEAALDAWIKDNGALAERQRRYDSAFARWQAEWTARAKERPDFSQLRFVLLHSLSHLLITQLSLECGYAASSIRERIYTGPRDNGILLYTASPGAEGSLGGLVEMGRRLPELLESALHLGRLCGSDPLCAVHAPDEPHDSGDRLLSGAACHGCLLISETSCERMNRYLDRSLVTPTLGDDRLAFFR
ncbi:MAG: DUF1998 domain-containing protein [Polyangiaceae bacterium]